MPHVVFKMFPNRKTSCWFVEWFHSYRACLQISQFYYCLCFREVCSHLSSYFDFHNVLHKLKVFVVFFVADRIVFKHFKQTQNQHPLKLLAVLVKCKVLLLPFCYLEPVFPFSSDINKTYLSIQPLFTGYFPFSDLSMQTWVMVVHKSPCRSAVSEQGGFPVAVSLAPNLKKPLTEDIRVENVILAQYGGWKSRPYSLLVGPDLFVSTPLGFGNVDLLLLECWECPSIPGCKYNK